ncbi:hypothetical protein PGT21_015314 [Puccinia graminis f. sp. tritici]|uniref:Uncharacterized protein n=1 Tax=Puccinia graminis f. sp. tritici TaxID=56615 RepID=A0A5B0QIM4_PUCGR|nr:hypothetical protein PGT21_015314 [Puccinia graminis f. sp. tritici]
MALLGGKRSSPVGGYIPDSPADCLLMVAMVAHQKPNQDSWIKFWMCALPVSVNIVTSQLENFAAAFPFLGDHLRS